MQEVEEEDEDTSDELDADEADGDELAEEADDEDEETSPDDEGEGGDDETTDEADEGDYEEVTYDDDDELDVVVDGETRTVSLRELKAKYSLQGATEKRLQEATETRKAAQAERAAFLQQSQEHSANLLRTLQQLDNVLFMPLIEPPDPALRTRDINKYLQQKDYYDEDQKRIADARSKMATYFEQQKQQQQQQMQSYRSEQTQMLVQKMPELADPKRAPRVQQEIMDAAAYYGFTPQQVAQVSNHAIFLMARDAARWLNLQKLKQNGGKELPSGGAKRRKLKSGSSVSVKKAMAAKSSKETKAREAVARKTGKETDVASFLASKAKVRSNKLGRFS